MKRLIFIWLVVLVVLTCVPAVYSASGDLVIELDSISFSNTSPVEGDAITITAVVRNQGDANISEDVEVRFTEGDPEKGGLQIGADAITMRLNAGDAGKVTVKWRAAPGKTEIHIMADPDNLIKESNEDNNTVVTSIKGQEWKGPKTTDKQIKKSIQKGLEWLKDQQGEFYVTCPNGHDNFLYSAIAYSKCVICGASLEGIEPRRISDQLLFTLESEFQSHLNNDKISEQLQKKFEENQVWLSPDTLIEIKEKGKEWLVNDKLNKQKYSIRKAGDKLDVHREENMPGGWMSEIGPGMTSLALAAFLYNGMDESDPVIQKGLKHLFNDAPVTWEGWTDAYDHAVGRL